MSETKPETINEAIQDLYFADKYKKKLDYGYIASIIDQDTGEVSCRVEDMLEKLESVL